MVNLQRGEIKRLRSDARKLTTIAKHLREQANELTKEITRNERAEKARANFYSKKAQIDGETSLIPELPE